MSCNKIFAPFMQQTQYKKAKALRAFALLFCTFYIAATLLSAAYIFTQSKHSHDHDGPGGTCATCSHIQAAEKLLKTIATAVTSVGITLAVWRIFLCLCVYASATNRTSLVSLKVRLNN